MTQAAGRQSGANVDPQKLAEARRLVEHLLESNRVVLFMEGERIAAHCAHSAQAVRLLERNRTDFTTFDVLADPVVARALTDKTQWVSFPQLFVDERFVGGCEAMVGLEQLGKLGAILSGELAAQPDEPEGQA